MTKTLHRCIDILVAAALANNFFAFLVFLSSLLYHLRGELAHYFGLVHIVALLPWIVGAVTNFLFLALSLSRYKDRSWIKIAAEWSLFFSSFLSTLLALLLIALIYLAILFVMSGALSLLAGIALLSEKHKASTISPVQG